MSLSSHISDFQYVDCGGVPLRDVQYKLYVILTELHSETQQQAAAIVRLKHELKSELKSELAEELKAELLAGILINEGLVETLASELKLQKELAKVKKDLDELQIQSGTREWGVENAQ